MCIYHVMHAFGSNWVFVYFLGSEVGSHGIVSFPAAAWPHWCIALGILDLAKTKRPAPSKQLGTDELHSTDAQACW